MFVQNECQCCIKDAAATGSEHTGRLRMIIFDGKIHLNIANTYTVMKSKLVVLLFAIVCLLIVFNENKPQKNQFASDACGYYIYLPAVFIYHDLGKLGFYPAADSAYQHSLGLSYSLHHIAATGNTLNKYPAGVACFELPLFMAAHTYASATGNFAADGFSKPYQLAGIFSNVFWVIAGLFLLRRFLKRYFNDNITAFTLLCIAFGTNLYVYNSFVTGMSHPYSFFLFSCLLLLTDRWYERRGSKKLSILTGLVAGFIFIVRPLNVIACIIPLFWMVHNYNSLTERLQLFGRYYLHLLLAGMSFFVVAFIQFAYWHYVTGHWFIYSYPGEGFDWLHPHIIGGLFSYRKGWFLYTPMAVAGCAGLYFLWKENRKMATVFVVFFIVMIYAVFSWHMWWYGGSFGCRPLVESLAFLSVPLAAITAHFSLSTRIKKSAFFTLMLLITACNIFQSYQYSMGLIHWDRMTRTYYWKVFGRVEFDRVENERYLVPDGR